MRLNNRTAMEAEDNRSAAARNFVKFSTTEAKLKQKLEDIKGLRQDIKEKDKLLAVQKKAIEDSQMEWEDHIAQIW